MTSTNRSQLLLILSIAGLFFSGTREGLLIVLKITGGLSISVHSNEYFIYLRAWLFIILGLNLLLTQSRSKAFSFWWLLSYTFGCGSLLSWQFTSISWLLALFTSIFLLIHFITAIAYFFIGNNAIKLIALSRIAWLFVLFSQIGFTFFLLFHTSLCSIEDTLYNVSWVLFLLVTMAESFQGLKFYRISTKYIGALAAILYLLASFFPSSEFFFENTLTKIIYFAFETVTAISLLIFVFYLHNIPLKEKENQEKQRHHAKHFVVVFLSCILSSLSTFGFLLIFLKDIGTRKMIATKAYIELLNQEKYNWLELLNCNEEYGYVLTSDLEYEIVDLDNNSMPVLFISGGNISEAAGTTRIVFYNEKDYKPYQVAGAWNCIKVSGYAPKGNGRQYPLIYCYGARQDMATEIIYEVRDQKLIEIAFMRDVYPYDTDIILPEYYSVPDSYYWMGEEVDMYEYHNKRSEVSDGYIEFHWKK